MTHLVYQDQRAEDLRLTLAEGSVDKEQLNIICSGKVELPHATLEGGIIGGSHYLELSVGGTEIFTEVFACTEVVAEHQCFRGSLSEIGSITKRFGDLVYRFRARKLTWNQGRVEFEDLEKAIASSTFDYQLGLVFVFPRSTGDGFSPVTMVYAKLDPQRLNIKVKTLHAYPNESTLVFTETVINRN